jgi:hypothetical protein
MEVIDGFSSASAISGACIGLAVSLVIVAIYFLIAMTRKPAAVVREKPRNLRQLVTPWGYHAAVTSVLQAMPAHGFKVEEVTPDGSRMILSTPITVWSYGFFYPIYFSAQPGGGTLVEVGIASRAMQWGPFVSRNHEKVFNLVREVVMPYIPAGPPQLQYPPAPAPHPQHPISSPEHPGRGAAGAPEGQG